MAVIEKSREIRLENLLSLRKRMTQEEINSEMMNIGKYLHENGLRKNGPIVTATFAVETVNGQPLLDMEILVPLDKKADLPSEYRFKEVFHLVNAVYARHEGNPNTLQTTYTKLLQYIQENGLIPVTPVYNVNLTDLIPGQSLDESIIDLYISMT